VLDSRRLAWLEPDAWESLENVLAKALVVGVELAPLLEASF
jgi:hypothetical protein